MQADTEETVSAEAERVDTRDRWQTILWRQEELERAGYPTVIALDIAERLDVDLHDACDLVRAGADPRVAREILL